MESGLMRLNKRNLVHYTKNLNIVNFVWLCLFCFDQVKTNDQIYVEITCQIEATSFNVHVIPQTLLSYGEYVLRAEEKRW